MKLIILGSGTSTGVPEVGCGCGLCQSSDPRDKRLRTSALIITDEDKRILIDCSPDFRQQALRLGLDRIDAILLTHEHYDHIGGLDDLRTIAWRTEIPIYGQPRVLDALRQRLHYVFGPHPYPGTPRLVLKEIEVDASFELFGLSIRPLPVMHGKLPILGYEIGDMTYITDMKTLEAEEWHRLSHQRLVVINALRMLKEHPSHQSIRDILSHLSEETDRPELTILTHLSHHAPSHRSMLELLPSNIRPACDGLCLMLQPDSIHSSSVTAPIAPFEYVDCGRIAYAEAWSLQHKLFDQILEQKRMGEPTESFLLFCEHNPVFTLGKNGAEGNMLMSESYLKQEGYDWFRVERGGDVTYHGPGQITGYPILDLERYGIGLRAYIELVEDAIIELLALYGLRGERNPAGTGVWLDADKPALARKICAIGVKSSRYVTMHGFALNVNTDLSPFRLINPCGFKDGKVSSIAQEVGYEVDFTVVKHQLSAIFFNKLKALQSAQRLHLCHSEG
ncbi:MAG: lipoyl(octanoyl) transferase LipB [Porphyromonadaceae bacterium]|nr:lipoyl(octanoyl) transferase LipB [Porphyromonadaceae bacterium]